jgi:hypothetical protein
MAQQINSLYGANVYMDGNNLAGRISEMELPTLKSKTTDHNVLGMAGAMEVFSGFEKLEGKMTWNSIHPDVMSKLFNPLKTVQLQLRGSLLTHTAQGVSQEVPYVCVITANFKNVPLGGFKPQSGVELAVDYGATYIKLTIDGADHLEFDVMNNTYKVDGVDVLDTYKTNLGW